MPRRLQLISGRSHPALAAAVAKALDLELSKVDLTSFTDGEINCRIDESVRGADVFVLQTHSTSNINDAIMEQALIIDACRRASAASITAVCPYLGYSRQDRKASGREPISARLVVDLLAMAGADRIMSVDLHSGQIQGFFNGPFDHLIARPTLVEYVKTNLQNEDLVIVAPDAGRVKSAERYGSTLKRPIAIIHKNRSKGEVKARYLIGDVKDKTCLIIDDMVDTAGTLCAAADLLKENGAKAIYGLATHGVLSGPALERIESSALTKVIVTDTLPMPKGGHSKLEVVSIAPLLASAIGAVFNRHSLSAIFQGKNQA